MQTYMHMLHHPDINICLWLHGLNNAMMFLKHTRLIMLMLTILKLCTIHKNSIFKVQGGKIHHPYLPKLVFEKKIKVAATSHNQIREKIVTTKKDIKVNYKRRQLCQLLEKKEQ